MEPIEKTHRNCKYFDTFKCLLRKYQDLIYQIKFFCILSHNDNVPLAVTADEYSEVKEKCNKACTSCDVFASKKTD